MYDLTRDLYPGALGFASGIGFNAPITAVQTALPTEDVSLGLSIVFFAQHFGSAVSVAIAQVIFTNKLSTNLAQSSTGLGFRDLNPTDCQMSWDVRRRHNMGRSLMVLVGVLVKLGIWPLDVDWELAHGVGVCQAKEC